MNQLIIMDVLAKLTSWENVTPEELAEMQEQLQLVNMKMWQEQAIKIGKQITQWNTEF